jgi:hypothetical protein
MNVRNLEQRLERLEHAILPYNESIPIIVVEYVPHGTDLPDFFGPLISGKMALLSERRAREKKSI